MRAKIEKLLAAKNMTPSSFAKEMGFNKQSFFNWMNDPATIRYPRLWDKIAAALDVDKLQLLDPNRDVDVPMSGTVTREELPQSGEFAALAEFMLGLVSDPNVPEDKREAAKNFLRRFMYLKK